MDKLLNGSGDGDALGEAVDLIGEKWTIIVVGSLANGPVRFNELRRRLGGVAQGVLTRTLRRLEEQELLTRTIYPTIPPRVEYELTEHGNALIGPLRALQDWARVHRQARSVRSAPPPSRGNALRYNHAPIAAGNAIGDD